MPYRPVTYQGSSVRDILALNAAQAANNNQLQQSIFGGLGQITGAIGDKADREAKARTGSAMAQLMGAGSEGEMRSILGEASGGQRVDIDALQKASQNRLGNLQTDKRIGIAEEAGDRAKAKVLTDATQQEFSNDIATQELGFKAADEARKVKSENVKNETLKKLMQGAVPSGEGEPVAVNNRSMFDNYEAINSLDKNQGMLFKQQNGIPNSAAEAKEMDLLQSANSVRNFQETKDTNFDSFVEEEAKRTGLSKNEILGAAPERAKLELSKRVITPENKVKLADANSNLDSALMVIADPGSSPEQIKVAQDKVRGAGETINGIAESARTTFSNAFMPGSIKDDVEGDSFGEGSMINVLQNKISQANKSLSDYGIAGKKVNVADSKKRADTQKKLMEYGSKRTTILGDITKKLSKKMKVEAYDDVVEFVDNVMPTVVRKLVNMGIDPGVARRVIVDNMDVGEHAGGWWFTEYAKTINEDILFNEAKTVMDNAGIKMKVPAPYNKTNTGAEEVSP